MSTQAVLTAYFTPPVGGLRQTTIHPRNGGARRRYRGLMGRVQTVLSQFWTPGTPVTRQLQDHAGPLRTPNRLPSLSPDRRPLPFSAPTTEAEMRMNVAAVLQRLPAHRAALRLWWQETEAVERNHDCNREAADWMVNSEWMGEQWCDGEEVWLDTLGPRAQESVNISLILNATGEFDRLCGDGVAAFEAAMAADAASIADDMTDRQSASDSLKGSDIGRASTTNTSVEGTLSSASSMPSLLPMSDGGGPTAWPNAHERMVALRAQVHTATLRSAILAVSPDLQDHEVTHRLVDFYSAGIGGTCQKDRHMTSSRRSTWRVIWTWNKAGLHAVNSLEGIADNLTVIPFSLPPTHIHYLLPLSK
ncbi:hypothetical protein C8R43DRAFT_963321 [Mycena crocata]|nr:hypothetical protein C8R43DRAFT_963321 [Mycena crocata]